MSLTATPNGDSNTPDGYSLAYVLTSGAELTIQQLGAAPEFTVTSGGLYTIHTFVFPSDLDLSVVVPGTTTGGDVLALLAANNICASLDVAGAAFNVTECPDECVAFAGSIVPEDFLECRIGGSATLVGIPAGDALVPAGYQILYVLTRGQGLVIQQVNAQPVFTVTQLGLYRIHTLVYDPATLDLSIVQFGTTTGFDVNGLLIQGGGSICASLDVTGAPHLVVGPLLCFLLDPIFGVTPVDPQTLTASNGTRVDDKMLRAVEQDLPMAITSIYPNPAVDQLNIEVSLDLDVQVEISILNAVGQEVLVPGTMQPGVGNSRMTIDVAGLPAGSYMVRMTMGEGVITERFTKLN